MMKRSLLTGFLCAVILCAGLASAQESWKTEFDEVCSKTQDAMTLSAGELQDLIRRCDALRPEIEKLSGAQQKVYLRRLQMCRDLYDYVLKSKEPH